MSEPFDKTMGQLRQMADLASLSVEKSPWEIYPRPSLFKTIFIVNRQRELIGGAALTFQAKGSGTLTHRPHEEVLRNAKLMAEAPVMRMVCEALARSGPDVAQALAYHQVQVPTDIALAIHLARTIMGRLS